MSSICVMEFEVGQFRVDLNANVSARYRGRGARGRCQELSAGRGPSRVGRGRAAADAGAASTARRPRTDQRARRRGAARRRPRLRGALPALPAAHPRLRARHGQGPRPRRGRHAGGLRLRAAPHARDRAADRLQALDLRDRQERLHRRVPALPARRGGLLRRRGRRSRPADYAGSSAPARRPTPRSPPSRTSTTCCGAFGGLSRHAPRDPRPARARGAAPTARSASAWA